MTAIQVPTEPLAISALDKEWVRVRAYIMNAAERGKTHDEVDVLAELFAGTSQLWAGANSAIVTQLIRHPKIYTCLLWLGGGNLQEMIEMEEKITEWAKTLGITHMEVSGRFGWERVNKYYKRSHIVLIKEVV